MRAVSVLTTCFIAAAFAAAPAQATTQIGDGTLSLVGLFAPTVTTGASTGSFSVINGTTFQISGTGAFAGLFGANGNANGSATFSNTVGTTVAESLANFLSFADGSGGTYNFSVDSVKTLNYNVTPGVSTAISLYLLGSTLDTNLGLAATATSLTLSFNSTGNSPFSTSATLSVPPAPIPSVPETATWAMMLVGFGAMGAAMRRRNVGVTFA